MRELITTSMEVIRGGNPVEVSIDGYVHANGTHPKEVEVTGVTDIDAWIDGDDESEDVELTEEENNQAEELLMEKFLES